MEDYPGLFDKIKNQEMGWPSKRESLKKVYLFIYNLWQLVGFLYICSVVITRYIKEGEGMFNDLLKLIYGFTLILLYPSFLFILFLICFKSR